MKWIPRTAASINTRNGLVDLQNGLITCQYTLSLLNEVPHWGLRESWCRPGAIGGTNARSMYLKIEERPLPLPSEWAIHHGAWETSERAGKELASSTSGCRKTHQFDKAQTLAMMRVSGPTSNRATSYSDNHIARESELFLKKKSTVSKPYLPIKLAPLKSLSVCLCFRLFKNDWIFQCTPWRLCVPPG